MTKFTATLITRAWAIRRVAAARFGLAVNTVVWSECLRMARAQSPMVIFEAEGYRLEVSGDFATLSSGSQSQSLRLAPADTTMLHSVAGALKKAGKNPADYFQIGGFHVLRRAALAAWQAAVAGRAAEKKAELAAEIAAQGRPALILHGGYMSQAALAYVRDLNAVERANLDPAYAARAVMTVGDWTAIALPVAEAFLKGKARQQDEPWISHCESRVIAITPAEWDALIAADRAAAAARAAKEAQKTGAAAARIEAARKIAESTGAPVEIDQMMVECSHREEDCSFDLLARFVRPDGSRFSTQTHCH